MINPNPFKIGEIFNSSVRFIVPRYQREYVWGKSEALELIEDLRNQSDGNLFLGTLIFDNSKERDGEVTIIDGQQRITTIVILLIACRNAARKTSPGTAPYMQDQIAFVDKPTGESHGPRLVASSSVNDILGFMSDTDWDGSFPERIQGRSVKRQINKIKPIFDYFFGVVSGLNKDELSHFVRSLYESYVVRIDIQNEVEAFSIFERTNARGVDLEVSDLLKNYLFAYGVPGLEERWSQIIENSDGNLLRVIKYFYVSRRGYVAKSDLYRKIKEYSNSIGAERLVDELLEFSRFYNVIKSAKPDIVGQYFESLGCTAISSDQDKCDRMYSAIEGLRLFKIFQVYPLAYSALQSFINDGFGSDTEKSKKIIAVFEALEKYHFINNAICERIGNEVEKPYANLCDRYSSGQGFEVVSEDLLSELRSKLAGKQEFISRFSELSYSPSSIPLLSYIFDRVNNTGLRPGQKVKIYNPDPKVIRKNHNIEHFYPRNPEDCDPEIADVVDNIGNLLSISFSTNSKLGNMAPSDKVAKLNGDLLGQVQNLVYVRRFLDKYSDCADNWNKSQIYSRAMEMAEEAYTSVWNF